MTDAPDGWRDAYNRMAKRAVEHKENAERLQAKLDQYAEAIALWDALEMKPGDHLTKAVIVAKVYDFEKGQPDISTAATDDCDWVDQIGLFGAWQAMNLQTPILPRNDDDT